MVPESVRAIKPDGLVWSQSSLNKVESSVSQLMIREAALQDEPELLRMMRLLDEQESALIKFDETALSAAFRQFLALPAFGRVWLLCEGSKTVGYVVLTVGFSFEFRGHDAFIDELYIDAPYRRRGYGRRGLAFAEERAREMGVNASHLEVDKGNDPGFELL